MKAIDYIINQTLLDEGTFSHKLYRLRIWDEDHFERLTTVLYQVAKAHEGRESVTRSLAYAYSFYPKVYANWIPYGHIDEKYSPNYCDFAVKILSDLNQYLLKDNDPFQLIADDFPEVLDELRSRR